MKAPSRRKQIFVTYKGWTYVQTPWRSFYGMQYAKALLDPEGKERMHAGYAKFTPRKKMRQAIKKSIEMLEKLKKINWEEIER